MWFWENERKRNWIIMKFLKFLYISGVLLLFCSFHWELKIKYFLQRRGNSNVWIFCCSAYFPTVYLYLQSEGVRVVNSRDFNGINPLPPFSSPQNNWLSTLHIFRGGGISLISSSHLPNSHANSCFMQI